MHLQMISQTHSYVLNKEVLRIHYFLPAINDSVVLIVMTGTGRDSIMHFGAKSEPLFEHCFNDLVDTLEVIGGHTAVVLLVPLNKIYVLDLKTHEVTNLCYYYIHDISCQINCYFFSDTDLFCIVENGAFNDPRLKITYLKTPLPVYRKQEEITPTCEWNSEDDDWTYEYSLRKANTHSMILWFRARHDEEFELRTFDLREDYVNGKFNVYRIRSNLGLLYNQERINCAMQEAWESSKGIFTMTCTTDKTELQCLNDRGNVNNTFIWDVNYKILRESKYDFDPKFNDYQIDIFSSGPFSMFRTFFFDTTGAQISPAYYINNAEEKIIAEETWKISHLSKWTCPGYNPRMFVEGLFENGPCLKIDLVTRWLCPRRLSMFHLLYSSMPFLDDDLLADATELLQNE